MEESRREFLKRAVWAGAGASVGGLVYTFAEAKWCILRPIEVQIPKLPAAETDVASRAYECDPFWIAPLP